MLKNQLSFSKSLAKELSSKKKPIRFLEAFELTEELVATRYKLHNGLDVTLLKDFDSPTVSLQIWYKVGSRHEKAKKTGLAHLFEHLMFGATRKRKHGEFDRLLEEQGAEANASTWTDWTEYHESFPKDALELALDLESDRMRNLILDKSSVESEKEVVANERAYRVDDDVYGFSGEKLFAHAFSNHPYGHPTIGWKEDILSFTLQDCRNFYKTYYAPNNANLILVGDFEEKKALEMIQAYFSLIPSSEVPLEKKVTKPAHRKERRFDYPFTCESDKIHIGYPGPRFGSKDWPAIVVLFEMLGAGKSSRLYQELVQQKELCQSTQSGPTPFEAPGLLEFYLDLRAGKSFEHTLRVFDKLIENVILKGPSKAELEKAKNRLHLAFLSGLEDNAGKSEQLGFFRTVLNDFSAIHWIESECQKVSKEQIQQMAKKYLQTSKRTVIHISKGS